jgi:hypothetical protein
MFHFDPIIPNRDDEIVRYINGYGRLYKIDSNVSCGTTTLEEEKNTSQNGNGLESLTEDINRVVTCVKLLVLSSF